MASRSRVALRDGLCSAVSNYPSHYVEQVHTARAIIILVVAAVLLVAAIRAPVLLLFHVIRGPLIYRAARHLWTRD